MGHRKKRVAFIPVRGGSKGIPKKNIREIAGKPLVYWVIDAVLESGSFDGIYISTDDFEIANVVRNHTAFNKLTLIERSSETATDTASTESAMIEFANEYEFEYISLIQATSPLLKGDDIRNAMEYFMNNKDATSLLSVCRQKRFIWKKEKNGYFHSVNYDPLERPRRQEINGFLVENGALYITDKENLLKTNSRLSGNIICYEMSEETYYELDEPSDWPIIESLLKMRRSDSVEKLKNIKLLLTDVDGVLTDSGMYYSEKGDELKKFNTRDGKGFEILRKSGIEVGIITSEDTQIVTDRAEKLKVNLVYQGVEDKNKILQEIINTKKYSSDEVAFIGDDINDISIIKEVGWSACPADAIDQTKQLVDYQCNKKGGRGCVREVADYILKIKRNI